MLNINKKTDSKSGLIAGGKSVPDSTPFYSENTKFTL